MATGFNYLMIYLPLADWPNARLYPGGFGVIDVIGQEPGLIERWTAWITGK
jgi:hypothetical protein